MLLATPWKFRSVELFSWQLLQVVETYEWLAALITGEVVILKPPVTKFDAWQPLQTDPAFVVMWFAPSDGRRAEPHRVRGRVATVAGLTGNRRVAGRSQHRRRPDLERAEGKSGAVAGLQSPLPIAMCSMPRRSTRPAGPWRWSQPGDIPPVPAEWQLEQV